MNYTLTSFRVRIQSICCKNALLKLRHKRVKPFNIYAFHLSFVQLSGFMNDSDDSPSRVNDSLSAGFSFLTSLRSNKIKKGGSENSRARSLKQRTIPPFLCLQCVMVYYDSDEKIEPGTLSQSSSKINQKQNRLLLLSSLTFVLICSLCVFHFCSETRSYLFQVFLDILYFLLTLEH